ncbi:MAG: hypothetical protein ACREBR_00025 [bacterium]
MELVDVGWVVRNMAEAACVESDSGKSLCCGHNHKLAVSLAERNSNAALRHIPEWLMSNAKLLQEAGNSYSEIYRFLAEKSREANKEVTFTYGDIKSALSDKQKTKALDTTQLFQYLTDRQNVDSNLGFELYQDNAQKLNRVFFVLKGGRELWCSMGASLVLFDTKHGTNAYGFKLGLFVTVDENGITRIVAGSFVKQEDVASFEWVFIQWNKFMHHSPAIIFTDSDKAMARGIKKVWGIKIKHFLCTYHLSKNFHQHIKPLFSSKAWKKYAIAKSMFWKLCLETDERSKLTFNTEWDDLTSYIHKNSDLSPEKLEVQLKWLESIKVKKEVWVGRYTWAELTFGVHSTQRIEAIHSSVARFCNKSHPLLVITRKLENLADELALKSETEAFRANHRKIVSSEIFLLNLVRELSGKATAYAIDRIFEQASQHKNYKATLLLDEVVEGEKRYKVDLTQEGKMKARHHSRKRARQWSSLRKLKKWSNLK